MKTEQEAVKLKVEEEACLQAAKMKAEEEQDRSRAEPKLKAEEEATNNERDDSLGDIMRFASDLAALMVVHLVPCSLWTLAICYAFHLAVN